MVLSGQTIIDLLVTLIGVFAGSLVENLRRGREERGQKKERMNRLLHDIYIELKGNSAKLVGKGYILNKDVWTSGISTGLIQLLDSQKLTTLSDLYHAIDSHIYESKICRGAGEEWASLPEGDQKVAARRRWERLSELLMRRETEFKERIDDFLDEEFWNTVGAKKNDV